MESGSFVLPLRREPMNQVPEAIAGQGGTNESDRWIWKVNVGLDNKMLLNGHVVVNYTAPRLFETNSPPLHSTPAEPHSSLSTSIRTQSGNFN